MSAVDYIRVYALLGLQDRKLLLLDYDDLIAVINTISMTHNIRFGIDAVDSNNLVMNNRIDNVIHYCVIKENGSNIQTMQQ